MFTRLILRVFWALLILAPDVDAAGWQAQAQAKARVFLDCNRCDEDYLKREITFIDYVRTARTRTCTCS